MIKLFGKKKEVVQEPLPEGRATAEIMVRKRESGITKFYEFYAQVISVRGFEERHLVKINEGKGFDEAVFSDNLEGSPTFHNKTMRYVRNDVQKRALNPIIQALTDEGFSPTHARGSHWFSVRFEKS